MKTVQYEDFLRDQLADDDFRHEYDELEEEFTIAREVIALRQMHNLTQKELAQRAGTSQPAIARLESIACVYPTSSTGPECGARGTHPKPKGPGSRRTVALAVTPDSTLLFPVPRLYHAHATKDGLSRSSLL